MNKWYIDAGPESDVVLSCRIRLARNFAEFPYPHRTDPDTRRRIMDRVVEAVMSGNSNMAQQFRFVDFTKLPAVERQVLMEKHLVSKELAESKI